MASEQLSSTYQTPASVLEKENSIKHERRTASIFAHIAFGTCLCLQRFGLPLGSDTILSASLPVLWALVGWMLLSGRARFYMPATVTFLIFGAWAILAAICAVLFPSSDTGFSLFSLIGVLATYVFFTLRPIDTFRGDVVKDVFLFYARLCAGLGILQFLLQFAHIRIFSFSQTLPFLRPILLERFFAWNPLLSYGSTTMRSNGFFLLEPSTFSQILCIAIILDYFIIGRKRWLPLYLIAYIVSFSGTGLLSLAITISLISLTSAKTFLRLVGMGAAGVAIAGVLALMLPKELNTFAGRFGEFGKAGTSGNARYVAQLDQLKDSFQNMRTLLGYGSGATVRSTHYIKGSGNAALQLLIDYGFIGLIAFYVFLCVALWRRGYAPLSLMLIVNFQVGGGYLVFAPYSLLICALVIWGCNMQAAAPVPAAPVRRPSRFALPQTPMEVA